MNVNTIQRAIRQLPDIGQLVNYRDTFMVQVMSRADELDYELSYGKFHVMDEKPRQFITLAFKPVKYRVRGHPDYWEWEYIGEVK